MMIENEKVKKGLSEIERIYAGQAIEQKNVRQLIDDGHSFAAIEDAVRSVLEEGNCSIEHIEEQIERIRAFDLTDIEETSRNFLEGKNCSIEHIEKQIERIRELENYL